jgi:hypothetical protein
VNVWLGNEIGLEEIQRAAYKQLVQNLDDQLSQSEADWGPKDVQFAADTGRHHVNVTLEPIAHYAEGHRPSLIEAPIELYPNVSVMAYEAAPDAEASFDQLDAFNEALYVEVMVKSPTYETEEDEIDAATIVNRRIQRTVDAVKRTISADLTLGGSQFQLKDPPSISITDAFIRREERSRGPRWLWQGGRLEYRVTKYSTF